MHEAQQSLLIFAEQLDLIREKLKTNVIRTANSRENPHEPLRPGKEVTYDATGQRVLPNSKTGISLAASFKQLDRIFRPGLKKWLLLVDRNARLPEGLRLQPDNADHWSVVVTREMSVDEFRAKLRELIAGWEVLGKFVRYE